jgi:hypothetical protein
MSSSVVVARIVDGVVVNLEVADQQWIDANSTGLTKFVPVGDSAVSAGMGWTESGGFSAPALVPPTQESIEWAAANGDTSWVDLLTETI